MPRRNRPKGAKREDPREGPPPRSVAQREACRSKQRFATESEADDAVYRARMEGTALSFYRCPWCEGFHLTRRGTE
ncbi:MAG TPA: hypothetical protein VFY99_05575 [Solirubrobacterales bacterium]